jgi:hypothetical protein
MNVLIQNPTTFFPTLAAAAKIADVNNQSDNEWKYLPVVLPNGKAKIMVVDEEGIFLGYL